MMVECVQNSKESMDAVTIGFCKGYKAHTLQLLFAFLFFSIYQSHDIPFCYFYELSIAISG